MTLKRCEYLAFRVHLLRPPKYSEWQYHLLVIEPKTKDNVLTLISFNTHASHNMYIKTFFEMRVFFFSLMMWFNSPRVCTWTYLLFITIIKMILWLFIATLLAEVQIIRIIENTGFWFIKTHLKGVCRWHKLRRASSRYVNRIVSYYIKYVWKKTPYHYIKLIWFSINWFTSYFQFKKNNFTVLSPNIL